MSNNTKLTLSSEIKNTLFSMNYPFLIIGSLFISILGTLLVLGHNPENFSVGIERIFGFTLTMTIILIAIIIGMLTGIVIGQYYKPRVLRYTNVPNDIEIIKNGLIALGSFVTTMENTINSKQIGTIFRNISKQLKKIPLIQSDIKAMKNQFEELKNTVKTLVEDANRKDLYIARLNQDVFRLKWENIKLKNSKNSDVQRDRLF